MGFFVLRCTLGKDRSDPEIGGVQLDHEGAVGVMMGEDGGQGEVQFEFLDGRLRLRPQVKVVLVEVRA